MKARTLSKREGEEVITIIRKSWPKNIELGKAKGIKSIECDEDTQILILERIKAIKTNEGIFPFLDQEETLENFPKIEIDLGAIKYVCNGADVMRPGIKIFKDFAHSPSKLLSTVNSVKSQYKSKLLVVYEFSN